MSILLLILHIELSYAYIYVYKRARRACDEHTKNSIHPSIHPSNYLSKYLSILGSLRLPAAAAREDWYRGAGMADARAVGGGNRRGSGRGSSRRPLELTTGELTTGRS